MEHKSIWKIGIDKNYCKTLSSDINCDILIIGGGLAGISTAYFLRGCNKDVVLIDKDLCGFGTTANTTGKLTFLQQDIYNKLRTNFDNDVAMEYLNSQKDAIKLVKNIVDEHNISCDMTKTSSYIFTNDESKIKEIDKEKQFFDDNKISYQVVSKLPVGPLCKYGLKVESGYVFHPLKYINTLKKLVLASGIKIYEKTIAKKLNKIDNGYEVETDTNKILAKKVIVCSHYPFFITPLWLPFKSMIEKSYVIVSHDDNVKKMQAINVEIPTQSIRFHTDETHDKSYMLYTTNYQKYSNHLDEVWEYEQAFKTFKKNINKEIDYYYSNHDVMTPDRLPFIGKINDNDDNLFVATGFNKWGMTNATLAGKILANMVLGKKWKYEDLFRITRGLSKDKVINLVIFNFITIKRLVLSKFKLYNHNKISHDKEIQDKHMVSNKCTHMGCGLIYNEKEDTWDCPCHGSKFDINGNIIHGPAKEDIKKDI